MTIQHRICDYLSREHVPFTIEHSPDEAFLPGCPAKGDWRDAPLVRVVPLFVDRQLAMLVIRAGLPVDRGAIVRAFPGRQVEPVDRAVVSIAFPDSDADCLPPFGVFWRMPVYIDDALNNEPLIRFHAGSPNDIVTLRREDFDRLSQPICVHVARTANLPTPELARTASRVEARLAESASRS